jgi:hypothetical protein
VENWDHLICVMNFKAVVTSGATDEFYKKKSDDLTKENGRITPKEVAFKVGVS